MTIHHKLFIKSAKDFCNTQKHLSLLPQINVVNLLPSFVCNKLNYILFKELETLRAVCSKWQMSLLQLLIWTDLFTFPEAIAITEYMNKSILDLKFEIWIYYSQYFIAKWLGLMTHKQPNKHFGPIPASASWFPAVQKSMIHVKITLFLITMYSFCNKKYFSHPDCS